jgi:hypothetical protein
MILGSFFVHPIEQPLGGAVLFTDEASFLSPPVLFCSAETFS